MAYKILTAAKIFRNQPPRTALTPQPGGSPRLPNPLTAWQRGPSVSWGFFLPGPAGPVPDGQRMTVARAANGPAAHRPTSRPAPLNSRSSEQRFDYPARPRPSDGMVLRSRV